MKQAGKIASGILIILVLIHLCQCSPYAGKSALRFFFDGVPETDSTSMASMEHSGMPEDSTDVSEEEIALSDTEGSLHYPFGEGECASCHNERSLGTMLEPQPALCYICHEDLAGQYNYLHGPVAGGYCTACHDPHRSTNEKLLRYTGEELCFYCHKSESVLRNEMHEGLEDMACTDCHNPHGGEDKYIFQ